MKVFIIGIAGGTGSRVARMLAEQGDEVRGLHRRADQTAFLKSIGVNGVIGDVAASPSKRWFHRLQERRRL
jgi:uncharacterized protein YbjT (DUF2867 family)